MNIKEVFHILETEKFNKYFNNTTLYHKIMLIKLRKSFSKYFFIPENTLYKSNASALFFINIIANKKILDIEEVKMDIYNKIPDLTLSIKYIEPPEVIKEIKDNIDKDIKILKHKIYTPNILVYIFNMSSVSISNNKILCQTAIKHKNCVFWLGNIISKNLNKITQQTTKGLDVNDNLIPLIILNDALYSKKNVLLKRVRKNTKIFGIDLSYVLKEKNEKSKAYFIKNTDYKKILDNKKYYIKMDIIKKDLKLLNHYERLSVIKYYKFVYNRDININNVYIKKENASNIIKTINLYKNNYTGYLEKLYDFINNSKINLFEINFIKGMVPFLRHMSPIHFNKKINMVNGNIIKDNQISKKDILKLLENLKLKSYKCNKSKQQGE